MQFATSLFRQLGSFGNLDEINLQDLESALPVCDLTDAFMAGVIIPPNFRMPQNPESTFYDPESFKIEWGEPVDI